MTEETPTRGAAGDRRLAGRPLENDHTACVAVYNYVERERKRTGLSVNQICKLGSFAWYTSGSPEWCSDGPDGPTKEREIKGRTLHRCYYLAAKFLKEGPV